jgi:hypothetical protein
MADTMQATYRRQPNRLLLFLASDCFSPERLRLPRIRPGGPAALPRRPARRRPSPRRLARPEFRPRPKIPSVSARAGALPLPPRSSAREPQRLLSRLLRRCCPAPVPAVLPDGGPCTGCPSPVFACPSDGPSPVAAAMGERRLLRDGLPGAGAAHQRDGLPDGHAQQSSSPIPASPFFSEPSG